MQQVVEGLVGLAQGLETDRIQPRVDGGPSEGECTPCTIHRRLAEISRGDASLEKQCQQDPGFKAGLKRGIQRWLRYSDAEATQFSGLQEWLDREA